MGNKEDGNYVYVGNRETDRTGASEVQVSHRQFGNFDITYRPNVCEDVDQLYYRPFVMSDTSMCVCVCVSVCIHLCRTNNTQSMQSSIINFELGNMLIRKTAAL